MKKVKETIVVEGRYDANTLRGCVDAHIIETSGFGIFNDKEKRALISRLAKKNGIIVFTDSDASGFVIRNHLRSIVNEGQIKHAYIPEIPGKERRKSSPSKEGLLGVEGMKKEIILKALQRAGATFEDEKLSSKATGGITKQDFYEAGLSGGSNSAALREKLSEELSLPKKMSANALLAAINMIFSREEYLSALSKLL